MIEDSNKNNEKNISMIWIILLISAMITIIIIGEILVILTLPIRITMMIMTTIMT